MLVSFPFLDTAGVPQAKPRPTVVISGRLIHDTTADILIAAMSSRPNSDPLPTDYQILYGTSEAQSAGVKVTSWVKASNLAAVPKAAVTRRLGRLASESMRQVERRLRLALELQNDARI